MDGPGDYYTKWSKSDRERQIPHDTTYIWNLKNKTNKQSKMKQTQKYREQMDGYQKEAGGRMGKIGEGD